MNLTRRFVTRQTFPVCLAPRLASVGRQNLDPTPTAAPADTLADPQDPPDPSPHPRITSPLILVPQTRLADARLRELSVPELVPIKAEAFAAEADWVRVGTAAWVYAQMRS